MDNEQFGQNQGAKPSGGNPWAPSPKQIENIKEGIKKGQQQNNDLAAMVGINTFKDDPGSTPAGDLTPDGQHHGMTAADKYNKAQDDFTQKGQDAVNAAAKNITGDLDTAAKTASSTIDNMAAGDLNNYMSNPTWKDRGVSFTPAKDGQPATFTTPKAQSAPALSESNAGSYNANIKDN